MKLLQALAYNARGIGRVLVEHAIDQARDHGAQSIEFEADPNGVPIYQHMGCIIIDECLSECGRMIQRMSQPTC